MTNTKVAILILAIAIALYIFLPGLCWEEDGGVPSKATTLLRDNWHTRLTTTSIAPNVQENIRSK